MSRVVATWTNSKYLDILFTKKCDQYESKFMDHPSNAFNSRSVYICALDDISKIFILRNSELGRLRQVFQ